MQDNKLINKQPVLVFFLSPNETQFRKYGELLIVCPSIENSGQILIENCPYNFGKSSFDRHEWNPQHLAQILDSRFIIAFDAKPLAVNLRSRLAKSGYQCKFHSFCLTRLFKRINRKYEIDTQDPLASYEELLDIIQNFDIDEVEKELKPLLKLSYLPPNVPADALDLIPDKCGVYLFYGLRDRLLYVGKSIHLRQRVISHFQEDGKNRRETKMCNEVRRIDFKVTAGELGALLLESDLIKRLKPVYNIRLRESNKRIALCLEEDDSGYLNCRIITGEKAVDGVLTGNNKNLTFITLFGSKREALGLLNSIVTKFKLCKKLCGIESGNGPCFGFQIKKCEGACCDNEPNGAYNARLNLALENVKFATWPFYGRIALKEKNLHTGDLQYHVVDQWRYIGSANSRVDAIRIKNPYSSEDPFDIDCYKIIKRYILNASTQKLSRSKDFRYRTLQIDKPKN